MEMPRYGRLISEFDSLVAYARGLADRLAGTMILTKEHDYADVAYLKLLAHAVSLRKLVPSPELPDGEFWDIGSACAVSRALIEAYDAFAYVALHEIADGERALRILVWELHDQQRRLRMLQKVGSVDCRVPEIAAQEARQLELVLSNAGFNALPKELRNKISKGDAPAVLASQRSLNEQSGINHDYYVAATMFLSQYVHSFPMALHQLRSFRAGNADSLALASMPLQYVLPFLAKAIEGAEKIWPGAVNPMTTRPHMFESWIAIAREGVTYAQG